MSAHTVQYRIVGNELQFVEILLDPKEAVIAEAGAMMCMDAGIDMKTSMGDGSGKSGVLGKVLNMGARALSGEGLFISHFTNENAQPQRVAFSAPYAGSIIVLDLTKLGGEILAQRSVFLCAAMGTAVSVGFQKKLSTGLFGGQGFILQKLKGDGLAFLHAGGAIEERELASGQELKVDTGCLVALQPSVQFDVEMVSGAVSMLFGGEGVFLARLKGPGKVWIQSAPYERSLEQIASYVLRRVPKKNN